MDKTDKVLKQFGKVTTANVVPIATDIIIPNHSGITGNIDANAKLTLQKITDNGATTTNTVTFNGCTVGGNIFKVASGGWFLGIGSNFYMRVTSDGCSLSGNQANVSAILDVPSTNKGFLPPRMTTAQKNAIGTPAAGLIVYDTDLGKLCVRTAAAWETITSA